MPGVKYQVDPLIGADAIRELTGDCSIAQRAAAAVTPEQALVGLSRRAAQPVPPITADVENDGDRDPDPHARQRSRAIEAIRTMPAEWLPVACFVLARLATLEDVTRQLTEANSAPVDRHARMKPSEPCDPPDREHVALGALWHAVTAIRRWQDPKRKGQV